VRFGWWSRRSADRYSNAVYFGGGRRGWARRDAPEQVEFVGNGHISSIARKRTLSVDREQSKLSAPRARTVC
jgi:hypothetical protein